MSKFSRHPYLGLREHERNAWLDARFPMLPWDKKEIRERVLQEREEHVRDIKRRDREKDLTLTDIESAKWNFTLWHEPILRCFPETDLKQGSRGKVAWIYVKIDERWQVRSWANLAIELAQGGGCCKAPASALVAIEGLGLIRHRPAGGSINDGERRSRTKRAETPGLVSAEGLDWPSFSAWTDGGGAVAVEEQTTTISLPCVSDPTRSYRADVKELFAEEDQVLRRSLVLQQNTASTLHDKMKSEESPSCPSLRRACLLLLG
ncbi:hypothetical protein G5714_014718 [Onychostoma macrolepis]|uniref:Uncharacterized protein n=1 Tax=Onychostoma macrolepis TaxID=369639 RepID=A0A7J6C9K1_9TELE|nr:hypothetical protein G5714_014718 [Onychostoma macrolepis]